MVLVGSWMRNPNPVEFAALLSHESSEEVK